MGLCGSGGEVTSGLGGRPASLHCSQIMNHVKSSPSGYAVVPNGPHRTLSSPARPRLAPASRAAGSLPGVAGASKVPEGVRPEFDREALWKYV